MNFLESRIRQYVRSHDVHGAKSLYKKLVVPIYTLAAVPVYDITASTHYKYTWFRIPKNGTHSIMRMLGAIAPPEVNSSFVPYFRRDHEKNFRFCVIRNPWDRLVSVYCNKVLMKLMFKECWNRDFEYFIEFVSKQTLTKCDAHLRLQTSMFPVSDVDFVARMEHFDEDIATILRRIGVDASVEHEGHVEHPDYHTYYTTALRDKVADLYDVDIRYGGYTYS